MTKTEIVEAAFKVWGRDFYRKTSLSQLSCKLRVSKTALYRHFENKQALMDAMTERFLEDFAASIRADFERAQQMNDADEGIFTIIRSISGFFARDVYALIFSLINIYDRHLDGHAISQRLKTKGADMGLLGCIIEKKYGANQSVIHIIFATLTFFMANFHRAENSHKKPPSEERIQNMLSFVCKIIEQGIGYSPQKIDAIDFEKQEAKVGAPDAEIEPLFKAVAEAVAEAGPWDVSMDMVAKRLGLSKSSLYGHFKSRKDMLRRLFIDEFKRIFNFARQGISLSDISEEQLYLGIFSITVYFRSHPEFLVSLDWIRTRKLDLGKPEKNFDIFRLFEDVDIEPVRSGSEDEKQRISHWILFLLINVLTRQGRSTTAEEVQNNDIRVLYRFITLGLGGFQR